MKYHRFLFFLGVFSVLLFSLSQSFLKAMESDEDDEEFHASTILFKNEEEENLQTGLGVFVAVSLLDKESDGVTVPAGVFGNKQPVSIAVPPNPEPESEDVLQESADAARFRRVTEDRTWREEALRKQGVPITEDNLASMFLNPQKLYDRLIGNFHGPRLLLYNASFHIDPQSGLILDAIKYTKSLQTLALVNALMRPQDYLSLAAALGANKSLKVLDLTGASFSKGILSVLAVPLQMHNGLEEIKMTPHYDFTSSEVEEFYGLIKENRGLRLIVWPENMIKTVKRFAKKGNLPAAVHMGSMYKDGILRQNLKEAEKYFTMHSKWFYERWTTGVDDAHPVSLFELGQIKEKTGKVEEALKLYERGANKGYPRAQVQIGDYHRAIWPQGTERQPDYEKAYIWYRKAATDSEDRVAYYRLGRMYEAGRHVPQNLLLATHYFYLSLERGFPHAFTALANLYRNPKFKGMDCDSARYYLMWALKFPDAQNTAQKLLNSFDKDTPEQL